MATTTETTKYDFKQPKITGAVVALWRERMGFSKIDAVTALGCSRGAFDSWENGETRVPTYIGLAMNALAMRMKPYGHAEGDD